MSEWKNKVKRPRVASEETYCKRLLIFDKKMKDAEIDIYFEQCFFV